MPSFICFLLTRLPFWCQMFEPCRLPPVLYVHSFILLYIGCLQQGCCKEWGWESCSLLCFNIYAPFLFYARGCAHVLASEGQFRGIWHNVEACASLAGCLP